MHFEYAIWATDNRQEALFIKSQRCLGNDDNSLNKIYGDRVKSVVIELYRQCIKSRFRPKCCQPERFIDPNRA